jgi:hypothetical protein
MSRPERDVTIVPRSNRATSGNLPHVAGTFPERINSIQVAFVPDIGNQGTDTPNPSLRKDLQKNESERSNDVRRLYRQSGTNDPAGGDSDGGH